MPNIKIITSVGDGNSDESPQNPDVPLEYRISSIAFANPAGQLRRTANTSNDRDRKRCCDGACCSVPMVIRIITNGPSDVVSSPVEVTGPPARRCVSLPNISISVTPIEIEMLQISADDSYNAASIIVKNKRGSFWKQTKRFFRRLICCCA